MKRKLNVLALSALLAAQSWAGTTIVDFNDDPALSGAFTNYGNAVWFASGGVGVATNGNDGFLRITAATSQQSAIVFQDFDEGAVVQGFTFECLLRVGNGTADPADGFSVNYARANDPAVLAADATAAGGGLGDVFAQSPDCSEASLMEEGTRTGLAIGFDAWQSGTGSGCSSAGPDIIGVSIRIDGTLVNQFPCPTKNGACDDPTSLQTGPRGGVETEGLCWAPLKVDLSVAGVLNVYWKGKQILTNYNASAYFPSPGRLVFAGRTGGSNQYQEVDNIKITTIPASLALVGAATGYADGFSVGVTDAGTTSVVNPASISATLNGAPAAPLTITKVGNVTTVVYHGFPALLAKGAANTVVLTVKDMNNNDVSATRTFNTPTYATVPTADAVVGVDEGKVGFKILPWQSGTQPNRIYWTEEQLIGLHGANNADLSLATEGGYIPFTGLINFNADAAGQAGSFQQGGGYPDSLFPGLPGANTLNGSTAIEALMYLKFPAAGIYTLCVNSDDGFLVTEAKNPKDRFATQLGMADRGKGASDETFTVAVLGAGTYPVRLIWENGNGELPGNGSNLEFFSITNGVKTLINDPSGANTTGIAAYYAGPALPAYVSHLYPPAGFTGVRADKLVAQITDSGTTLAGGSAKLYVDGVQMGSTATKVGATTTVEGIFTPTTMMAPGVRTAALVWNDSGGTARSNTWTFTVANWVMLNAGLSAPLSTADTTKPGLTVQVAQLDPDIARPGAGDGMANQVDSANALLGGLYFPWYATNTVQTNSWPLPLRDNVWAWESPVDFNIVTSPGDFTWDQVLPGIPGVTGQSDNLAAWFTGYVAFTNAGYYRMQISSDDGFRVSQGKGITRQVLHVKGSGVDRDVAAVVCSTNNSSYGASLPVVPISGPVVYFPAGHPAMLSQATNLTGKVAVMNNTDFSDWRYSYWAQTNGAIASIVINDQQWGLPYVVGGTPPSPIHIPVMCVNGFGGEEQMWATNTGLVATIGADAQLQIGIADYGKGMGWIDCALVVPQPGLYPLHLLYEQGGGGAGLEWATAYADTLAWDDVRRVLVNDTTTPGSINAYRDLTVQPTPTISAVKEAGVFKIVFTGMLMSSSTVNGTYTPVAGATSPYTIPAGPAPAQFYRSAW